MRLLNISIPSKGAPTPLSRIFVDGFLMDDEEGDGFGSLLAVSMIHPAKEEGSKKKVPEEVFGFAFGETDRYLGASKNAPRVRSINLEKTPWEFETQHVACHWAKVPGLTLGAVKKIGGRYDEDTQRVMADSPDKLSALLSALKATATDTGIMGSSYQRLIGRSHALTGKNKSSESGAFYLYGPTLEVARKKFYPVLLAMEIPMLKEWDNHFWKLFQSAGWVKPLTGHRMCGYRVSLNRASVCALISREIKARHNFLRPADVPEDLWV